MISPSNIDTLVENWKEIVIVLPTLLDENIGKIDVSVSLE